MNPQSSLSPHSPFQPEDVQRHLAALRDAQRGVGKFVGEVETLSESHEVLLTNFLARNSEVIAGTRADPRFRNACERLLCRYLELARRHDMTIGRQESCVVVFHELTKELRLNCGSFKLSSDKLVTATLLSDRPVRDLKNEAQLALFIRRFPSIVERAVMSSPADPHRYVRDIAKRFSDCRDHEASTQAQRLTDFTILFLAKTYREMEPLARLALFRKEQQSLLDSDEFRPLRATFSKDTARSRFIEELLTRFKAKECRTHLSKMAALYREIYDDESFAQLRARRADIRVALQRYGDNTKQFLSDMLEQESRIVKLAEKCGEPLTPKDLRVLCLRTPRKAAALEAALTQRSAGKGAESSDHPSSSVNS